MTSTSRTIRSPPSTEGIYQSFQIGRVLFLLTDSRYAKSPRKRLRYVRQDRARRNQKTWLKSELLRGKDLRLDRLGQLDSVDR